MVRNLTVAFGRRNQFVVQSGQNQPNSSNPFVPIFYFLIPRNNLARTQPALSLRQPPGSANSRELGVVVAPAAQPAGLWPKYDVVGSLADRDVSILQLCDPSRRCTLSDGLPAVGKSCTLVKRGVMVSPAHSAIFSTARELPSLTFSLPQWFLPQGSCRT